MRQIPRLADLINADARARPEIYIQHWLAVRLQELLEWHQQVPIGYHPLGRWVFGS